MKELRVSAIDRTMFGRAVEAAYFGEHYRVRVGAVLTRGRTTRRTRYNRVAHNQLSAMGEQYYIGHAERQVIRDQPAIKGTLYVARLDLSSELVASWPCDECMAHIKACACVSKIVYHDGAQIRKVRL